MTPGLSSGRGVWGEAGVPGETGIPMPVTARGPRAPLWNPARGRASSGPRVCWAHTLPPKQTWALAEPSGDTCEKNVSPWELGLASNYHK